MTLCLVYICWIAAQKIYLGDEERLWGSDPQAEEAKGRRDRCCYKRNISDQVRKFPKSLIYSHTLNFFASFSFVHDISASADRCSNLFVYVKVLIPLPLSRSVAGVIEKMEQFSSRLGELSSRVESTHEHTAHGLEQEARHRDQQLRSILHTHTCTLCKMGQDADCPRTRWLNVILCVCMCAFQQCRVIWPSSRKPWQRRKLTWRTLFPGWTLSLKSSRDSLRRWLWEMTVTD